MLSRRNVRVKVMQVLYAQYHDQTLQKDELFRYYRRIIQDTYVNYLLHLQLLLRVAAYSTTDKELRRSKYLTTEEDLKFKNWLWQNQELESVRSHKGFQALVAKFGLDQKIDGEFVRKLYVDFSKSEDYLAFAASDMVSNPQVVDILYKLYKAIVSHELFNEFMDDNFTLWQEDKSLVTGAMKKTIKALPVLDDFYAQYEPPAETVVEFGEVLLGRVIDQDEELRNTIGPVLENWDADRVASIDMILLKMALSEVVAFPTIPVKVTLNEYVEISKTYSTEKSKEFINGVLDRLFKKMLEDGRIVKTGRGLLDE